MDTFIEHLEIFLTYKVEILIILIFFYIFVSNRRPKNYPPGPYPLPLVGNFHNLGTKPFRTFMDMRKKYGDVFAIDFGLYPAIVLNGHKVIRKYLNMNQTAGRPNLIPFIDRSEDNTRKGIASTEGMHWVEQRRFVIRNLRDFGFGRKTMEGMINDEIDEIIWLLRKASGKPIDCKALFNRAVVNSLYTICAGERATGDDKQFESILKNLSEFAQNHTAVTGLLWFFPTLCKMFPVISGYDFMKRWSLGIINILKIKIMDHRATIKENEKRDLIDCYITEINNTTDPRSSFHQSQGESNMHLALSDLLGAGSETTSTTLSWAFLILSLFPEVQQKLHNEIDSVIGPAKPSLSLKENMPFTQCFIAEILRYSSLVPLSVFHSTTETVEIEGYTVPKGTIIVPNIYGAHFDKDVWGQDADEFRPERFLTNDGKTANHEALIPFGTGKRICIGELLARDSLFLFITSITQVFQVTFNPAKKPTLEYAVGIVLSPLYHELIFQERG